jgi:hypothetical protein
MCALQLLPCGEINCVVCGSTIFVHGATLASSRGIAPKRTHVIERGLYCFLELGALRVLRRSVIVHRSPELLDDRR